MTKTEILRTVVNVHNTIFSVCVSGDNAILVGDSIRALRGLGDALQKDIDAEAAEAAKAEKQKEGEPHESA